MKFLLALAFLSLGACARVTADRAPSSASTSSSTASCANLERLEVHAHRGAFDRPENQMAAFLRAVDLGADWVELDLQVTRDDQLVVAHDAYLRESCLDSSGRPLGRKVYFRHLTLEQVKTYDCGSKLIGVQAVPGEKVPTLAEVLHALEKVRTKQGKVLGLNIEIKFYQNQTQYYSAPDVYVRTLLSVLDESRWNVNRYFVQSFNHDILKLIRQKRSDIRLAPLLSDEKEKEGIIVAKELKADTVTPSAGLIDARSLTDYHRAGIRVVPWTVNSPDQMARLIQLGVDGLITDRPDIIDFGRQFCK